MTLGTLERLLPRMCALVILQHVLVPEGPRAHATGEHLVPSVFARLGADRSGWTKRCRALHRRNHVLGLRLRALPLRRVTLLRHPVPAAAHHVVIVVVVVVGAVAVRSS